MNPLLLSAIALTATPPQAPNLKEDYEVKVLLNPDVVLDPTTHTPTSVLLSTFSFPRTPIKMNVQFLDDDAHSIYHAGWSPCIRRTKDKPLELTYKKSYPIKDENIDAALTAANADGFDASDTRYEAQVEWGYINMTLSVSREKRVDGGVGTTLPGVEKARKMMVDEAPDKFKNSRGENWGDRALGAARLYGPILADRFVGAWHGVKLYVEIWPIMMKMEGRLQYFVEASFKVETRAEASSLRMELISMLEDRGWLSPEDSLKTRLIMENY